MFNSSKNNYLLFKLDVVGLIEYLVFKVHEPEVLFVVDMKENVVGV